MEVKINREIRNYTESMFFGLSMRQFFFSLIALVAAVGLYFILNPLLDMETVSWMCILAASPFAAMGFISYNGQTFEQFIWAWIKSEVFEKRTLRFETLEERRIKNEKKAKRRSRIDVKDRKEPHKAG